MKSNTIVVQPVVSRSQKVYLEMKLLHVVLVAISYLEQKQKTKNGDNLLPSGFTTCPKCGQLYPSSLKSFHQTNCPKRPKRLKRTLSSLWRFG